MFYYRPGVRAFHPSALGDNSDRPVIVFHIVVSAPAEQVPYHRAAGAGRIMAVHRHGGRARPYPPGVKGRPGAFLIVRYRYRNAPLL